VRTIAVLNQKGGVGKTTTVANVAGALAGAGRKVVVIDLDPQSHLTIHLGVEPRAIESGGYEVLTQSADFAASLLLVRPNLWLLAANIDLVGAETELVNVVGREIILREAMQASQDRFDFCLIDCAPSLGLLSLNALAAAQEVLIPLQPHFLALQGFGKLLQTVDLVNKRINPDLKVTGVLLCMHDTRASLSNEVRADVDRFLQSARGSNNAWSEAEILPAFIRRNIKLAEAPSYGQTIFEYDPGCNGAEDYGKVARFLLGLDDSPEPVPAAPATEPGTSGPTDAPDGAEPSDESPVSAAPEPQAERPTEAQNAPESSGQTSPAAASERQADNSVAPAEAVEASEETPPAVLPIAIREVYLPAPRCYSPVPIWTDPAGSTPPSSLPEP
jgi:chromosome partitioning protein